MNKIIDISELPQWPNFMYGLTKRFLFAPINSKTTSEMFYYTLEWLKFLKSKGEIFDFDFLRIATSEDQNSLYPIALITIFDYFSKYH